MHGDFLFSNIRFLAKPAKKKNAKPKANSQPPTANSQQPTANSQQPTANRQPPKANRFSLTTIFLLYPISMQAISS